MSKATSPAPRLEPSWATAARVILAVGIMVSMMVMISFMLTGDRGLSYTAIAVGLCLVACIPAVEWIINHASYRSEEPDAAAARSIRCSGSG